MNANIFYIRNLPHFQSDYSYYFITFRLFNSLQKDIIEKLNSNYVKNKNLILKLSDEGPRSTKLYELQKKYFGIFDKHLDINRECINYLAEPKIAFIVAEAIKFRDKKAYKLISYCIMPNHVHLLIYVERFVKPLYRIMQSLKRHTAREANKVINRSGTFWHEESYDHIVRNQKELINIIKYIMHNPVKAGLVENKYDWKWSYCKFNL